MRRRNLIAGGIVQNGIRITGLNSDGSETSEVTKDNIGLVVRDLENKIEFIIGNVWKLDSPWGYKEDTKEKLSPPNVPYIEERGIDINSRSREVEIASYNNGYTGTSMTDTIVKYGLENGFDNTNSLIIWASEQRLKVGNKNLKGYLGSLAEFGCIQDFGPLDLRKLLAIYMSIWNTSGAAFYATSEIVNDISVIRFNSYSNNIITQYNMTGKYGSLGSGSDSIFIPFFRLDRFE